MFKEVKDVVRTCRKEIKVSESSEFNLATTVKDNKNVFINTSITKGGTRKTSILYWTRGGLYSPKMPQFSAVRQVILRITVSMSW